MTKGRVFMVVALAAEAKPLVEHWHMTRDSTVSSFPIFVNSDGTHWLIQCGVGKIVAATAVGFLAQRAQATKNDAWLNIGIAGSATHSLGTLIIGHKISDAGGLRNWYPSQIFQGPGLGLCPSTEIQTVDRPSDEYPKSGVVEMEASGFCGAAMRFGTVELVQAIKVVSDTPDHPIAQITKENVKGSIANKMKSIELVVNELLDLSREATSISSEPLFYEELRRSIHFTVAQSHQLRRLLRRWEAVMPDRDPMGEISEKSTPKIVLAELKGILDTTPIDFSHSSKMPSIQS